MLSPAHLVGHAPGQQFVEHDADGVDIAPSIDQRRIPGDLLRAHVGQRADQLPFACLQCFGRRRFEKSGDAEVEHLRLAQAIDQDVARFDVAVDDAPLVRVLEGVANPRREVKPSRHVQIGRRHVLFQRGALDELHREVRLRSQARLGGARLVDLRDSGMLQPAKGLRFPLEPLEQLAAGRASPDHLQRDASAGRILLRLVDRAHASLT